MRKHGRTDANQSEIVAALRKCGASVQILSSVGRGVPDLIVGWRGVNYLMEVKDGTQPPSRRSLTPDEQAWHVRWSGQVAVVDSAEAAISMLK